MEQLKNRVRENLERIFNGSINFTLLKPNSAAAQSWNGLTYDELDNFVERGKKLLKSLLDNIGALDNVNPLELRNLDTHISEFINQYSANGLNQLQVEQVSSQHHSCLNYLNGIFSIVNQSGLGGSILYKSYLGEDITNFKEAERLANVVTNRRTTINDAISSATKWLSTRQDVNKKTIEEQAEAFYDMAIEHKVFKGWSGIKNKPDTFKEKVKIFAFSYDFGGSWFWLLLTIIFAASTGLVTYEFIIKAASETPDIKVGTAILRIAGLLVPAYLTLFSANQFLYHKRLYDNYMFKYSSMQTMNNLMSIHEKQGEQILAKGLDILFSEPKTKEGGGKYDPQLMNEMLKMLRDQMNKP
jgi:hypothetical protein